MINQFNNYRHTSWLVLVLLVLISTTNASAQRWDSPLDSVEADRIKRRGRLQAEPQVQRRVDEEINEYRLLMLSHEWWGLPTDREQTRLNKARNERYQPYSSPLENSDWRAANGAYYRNQEKLSDKQQLIILGWHPYWEGEAYKAYNFKLLTHLAYYGYEVNPFTGGYRNFRAIYDFQDSELIPTAHLDSCKVLLTVSLRGEDAHDIFFTGGKEVQNNLIDSLRTLITRSGADGVDIDFEAVPYQYKQDFWNFIEELSFAIREDNNEHVVSMSLPVEDKYNIYNLGQLKPWIDFFSINGFNFHIQQTHLQQGPLAPLLVKDAPVRGTVFTYERYTNLADLLLEKSIIQEVTIQEEESYIELLKDSLNQYIQSRYPNLEYETYDMTSILNTIKISSTSDGLPLAEVPTIKRLLGRTRCTAQLKQRKDAATSGKATRFFLFEPEATQLPVKEYALFNKIGNVTSAVDSQMLDIAAVIEEYKYRIGKKHHSSLIMGLPYHGAVWYRDGDHHSEFEGYMPYSEILKLVEDGQASVSYDKATHSLVALKLDTLRGVYQIYFDNSTTLSKKYDYVLDQGLGGVGVWSLGADYSHTELWATLEQSFVTRRVWNDDLNKNTRIRVEKGNKITYTINYLLKHFSSLTFATLFFITIFIGISFCFSVLDWKVRDVLFYSGAFRIFYLVLFTVILLIVASIFHLFENVFVTFFIGALIGLVLTWTASNLVEKKHQKLP